MEAIRESREQFVSFALKPSLLRALWNDVREGAASATLGVRFADGARAEIASFDELAPVLAGNSRPIRQLSMEATMPDRTERRAVFAAGNAFIRNEFSLEGPRDFVDRGRAWLKQGLTPGAWRYPDLFTLLYLFTFVFLISGMLACRAAGLATLPTSLALLGGAAVPVLIVLRLLFPPAIRVAEDDRSFERAASLRRGGLMLALCAGLANPFTLAWL